jgi:hypothetical protein
VIIILTFSASTDPSKDSVLKRVQKVCSLRFAPGFSVAPFSLTSFFAALFTALRRVVWLCIDVFSMFSLLIYREPFTARTDIEDKARGGTELEPTILLEAVRKAKRYLIMTNEKTRCTWRRESEYGTDEMVSRLKGKEGNNRRR